MDSLGCEPAVPPPSVVRTLAGRLGGGLRKARNWWQLLRFSVVGFTGYIVNLSVFSLLVTVLDADHRLGATVSFVVAVSNNFAWNRRWTFRVTGPGAHRQAVRFFVISLLGFGFNLALLEALVLSGVPELPAQALAVAMVMPVNFIGNRFWTFGVRD